MLYHSTLGSRVIKKKKGRRKEDEKQAFTITVTRPDPSHYSPSKTL